MGPASISELARPARISLPGVMKHVHILEEAHLVTTSKLGRTRECRLDAKPMDDVTTWIEARRQEWERRFDRLEAILEDREKDR